LCFLKFFKKFYSFRNSSVTPEKCPKLFLCSLSSDGKAYCGFSLLSAGKSVSSSTAISAGVVLKEGVPYFFFFDFDYVFIF